MECRFATKQDKRSILCSIGNKKIDFITRAHLNNDIDNEKVIVCVENEKILGSISLIRSNKYCDYMAKRLCVYNKKNYRKGVADSLIGFLSTFNHSIGCTPWTSNKTTIHLLEKYGFQYQYTFNGCWEYYYRK